MNYADDDDDYGVIDGRSQQLFVVVAAVVFKVFISGFWDCMAGILTDKFALLESPHTIETRRAFLFAISYSRLSGNDGIASGIFGDGLFVRSFSKDRVLLKVLQLFALSSDIIFIVDTNDAVVFKFVDFVGFMIGVSPSYWTVDWDWHDFNCRRMFSNSSGD
uniref:Uncharacterized protein n=1 Tax=Glossina brevipalpis TaxID=37001 RepID=A0A1A9WJS2_9MUSC